MKMRSKISESCTRQHVENGTLLGHFFSQSVWGNLAERKKDRLYDAVVRRYISPYCDDVNELDNADVLHSVYRLISRKYRNEYFYRNELLFHFTRVHSKARDAVALSQLKVAKSRADFVLVNGTAAVYEIKTDQDTFARIDTQLTDYYKAFPYVYVVVGESHLSQALSRYCDTEVGICTFSNRRMFQCVKDATEKRDELRHRVLFDILHANEIDNVLSSIGIVDHAITAFDAYFRKLQLFSSVDMDYLYPFFQTALKSRMQKLSRSFLSAWPTELAALVYFWNERNRNALRSKISGFLKSRYTQLDEGKSKVERMRNVCALLSLL